MADVKKISINVDQIELDVLVHGLELARKSLERRISAESGEVADVYKRRLAVVTALAARLPRVVS